MKKSILKRIVFFVLVGVIYSSLQGDIISFGESPLIIVKDKEESATNFNTDEEYMKGIKELLKTNYEKIYLKRVTEDPYSFEEYYNASIDGEFGINTFFRKKFPDESNNQINHRIVDLLCYYNDNGYVIDNSYGFLPVTYSVFEDVKFIKSKGRDDLLKKTKYMSDEEKVKLFEFYTENLEDFIRSSDSDIRYILEVVDPRNLQKGRNKIERKFAEKIDSMKKSSVLYSNNEKDKRVNDFIEVVDGSEISNLEDKTPLRASIRNSTLSYARKHGYNNYYSGGNPPYPYYDYSDEGGDCANFVSQCLRAGNIGFWQNGEESDRSWYFHNYYDRSQSWIVAQNFRLHWQLRVPAEYMYVKDSLSFLEPATPISLWIHQKIIELIIL